MKRELETLPEPGLQFRYGQSLVDPHDGISMFGPYDADLPEHPSNISYGVIGTPNGLSEFARFSAAIREPILNNPDDFNPKLWPNFPGFESAFSSKWPAVATHSLELVDDALINASMQADPHKRAAGVVELYLEKIKIIHSSEKNVSVIVCVVPDVVFKNCRTLSTVKGAIGDRLSAKEKKSLSSGQSNLFDSTNPETYQFSVDFRRQLKARAMQFNIPIQIMRETTLRLTDTGERSERGLTCLSDRAWNLSTTAFYKAGGQPWKLATAREGVCYVGLVFKLTDTQPGSRSACCAAQMFLDSGDGVVFRGQDGKWYSPEDKKFQLSKDAAKNLLGGLLKTYFELGGKPLKEIFIHCHSAIDEESYQGFKAACPSGATVIAVRVRQERSGLRLYREGRVPVLRGTYWEINPKLCFLWGSGFKPRLDCYDGWEVPAPLRIDVQHGEADIRQVALDILGLTKLNYNSCKLGESEPVTIGFSDAVGEILVSNPTVTNPSPKFKFYI